MTQSSEARAITWKERSHSKIKTRVSSLSLLGHHSQLDPKYPQHPPRVRVTCCRTPPTTHAPAQCSTFAGEMGMTMTGNRRAPAWPLVKSCEAPMARASRRARERSPSCGAIPGHCQPELFTFSVLHLHSGGPREPSLHLRAERNPDFSSRHESDISFRCVLSHHTNCRHQDHQP